MNLKNLSGKKRLKIIGLMSGTSANGIDACLVELERKKANLNISPLGFKTFKFPPSLQKKILEVAEPGYQNIDEIIRLDFLLGEYFARAAKKMAESCGLRLREIDLIGSHGQTVRHLPSSRKMGTFKVRGTLQIGEPSVISARTGITAIADFRRKDIAVGGEGAPLTPLAHFHLFNSKNKAQVVLNLGGISNLTFLPEGDNVENIWGMDAGPGNMLIDALMRRYFKKDYDRDGLIAFKGKMIEPILGPLLRKILLLLKVRKSLGREDFGEKFIEDFVRAGKKYRAKPEDLITTATELTARSVYFTYEKFFLPEAKIEELILCGGGALNRYITKRLKELFYPAKVFLSDKLGYHPLSIEPISFALFAFLTLRGSGKEGFGSSKFRVTRVSGKICLP